MPTGQKDYSKGIIYKLCCSNPEITEIYIGSTLNFRLRKAHHKRTCNNIKYKDFNTPVYQFIRDNGNWDNWDMVQIEEYACNTKKELESRERYWIELLKSSLNRRILTSTEKEYYDTEKEYYDTTAEYYKEYYIQNKEVITENRKQTYICACSEKPLTKGNKSSHEKTKKHINFYNK